MLKSLQNFENLSNMAKMKKSLVQLAFKNLLSANFGYPNPSLILYSILLMSLLLKLEAFPCAPEALSDISQLILAIETNNNINSLICNFYKFWSTVLHMMEDYIHYTSTEL